MFKITIRTIFALWFFMILAAGLASRDRLASETDEWERLRVMIKRALIAEFNVDEMHDVNEIIDTLLNDPAESARRLGTVTSLIGTAHADIDYIFSLEFEYPTILQLGELTEEDKPISTIAFNFPEPEDQSQMFTQGQNIPPGDMEAFMVELLEYFRRNPTTYGEIYGHETIQNVLLVDPVQGLVCELEFDYNGVAKTSNSNNNAVVNSSAEYLFVYQQIGDEGRTSLLLAMPEIITNPNGEREIRWTFNSLGYLSNFNSDPELREFFLSCLGQIEQLTNLSNEINNQPRLR